MDNFLTYLKNKYHANKELLGRIEEDLAGIHMAETENEAIEKTFAELGLVLKKNG